jgi:hypothetical protein
MQESAAHGSSDDHGFVAPRGPGRVEPCPGGGTPPGLGEFCMAPGSGGFTPGYPPSAPPGPPHAVGARLAAPSGWAGQALPLHGARESCLALFPPCTKWESRNIEGRMLRYSLPSTRSEPGSASPVPRTCGMAFPEHRAARLNNESCATGFEPEK